MSTDTALRCVWLLLHDREFVVSHARIDPALFPKGAVRYLVDLALRQWGKYRRTVTATALAQALDVESHILRRQRTDTQTVAQVYIDLEDYEVEEEARPAIREAAHAWLEHRALTVAAQGAQEALDEGDVDEARQLLAAVGREVKGEDSDVVLPRDASKVMVAERAAWKGGIPTGIYDLDKVWKGGIHPGELGIVLAPTGIGKSMILCQFAACAYWLGKNVLYYTYELTTDQIAMRCLCGILERGQEDLGDVTALLAKTAHARRLGEPPLAAIHTRTEPQDLPGILDDMETYKEENGSYPGMLILDSADDLTLPGKFRADHERLLALFVALRRVAREMKIPIWTSGQATKEAVDKARISLRHMGGAYAKAQKSHLVLGLTQTPEEREDTEGPLVNIYVLKDSLHGSRGAWLRCQAAFGLGENGYPGLEVVKTRGLPGRIRREE